MTIPLEGTSFVNWHFVDTFLNGRARLRVAGKNFMDTTPLLGREGIRECAEELRRGGVALEAGRSFWAADRNRALLDLVLSNIAQGRSPDHLRLEDYFENEADRASFERQIATLKTKIQDRLQTHLLEQWMQHQ
jgi:hypothetical protein